jgi:predicted metal-dependent hydrolase
VIYIRDGVVDVRVPLRMPDKVIEQFVASREGWINKKLEESRQKEERREAFVLDYSSMVLFRGKEYPLVPKAGNKVSFDGGAFYIPPGLTEDELRGACVQLYRALAKRHMTARVIELAALMGQSPASVKITDAKTRWGSCSSLKTVNFSWRLVLAGDELIDYVVVHELAHLVELNHSARFWKIVGDAMPDYKAREARLKELQKRLSNEGWR